MKLSEKLNNFVSQISSIMKTCDINKIGIECMRIAGNPYISVQKIEGMLDRDILEIDFILDCISKEPLNDKLDLNPRIFAAQQEYVERRLRVKNLETYHTHNKR